MPIHPLKAQAMHFTRATRRIVVLGAAGLMIATATPSAACGAPALGEEMDRLISSADATRLLPDLAASRQRIASLAAAGDLEGARRTEEEVMRALGFEKVWLRCGAGSFAWVRVKQQ